MMKSTAAFRLSPWLEDYRLQPSATSPNNPIPLRPAVVMLLMLVFTFCNSHVFAQRYNYEQNATTTPLIAQSIISQPMPVPGALSVFAMDAGNSGLFFSPGSLVMGSSPASAMSPADSVSGDSLWGDGPAVVAVRVQGTLFVGALVNNRWSSADSSETNITPTMVQPFIHYDLPDGWYVNAITTSMGEMCGVKHVSAPLGPSLGLVHCFGELPVNLQWGAYYNNTEGPAELPGWQLRFQIQLPFSF